jgi:hypothetical protein
MTAEGTVGAITCLVISDQTFLLSTLQLYIYSIVIGSSIYRTGLKGVGDYWAGVGVICEDIVEQLLLLQLTFPEMWHDVREMGQFLNLGKEESFVTYFAAAQNAI